MIAEIASSPGPDANAPSTDSSAPQSDLSALDAAPAMFASDPSQSDGTSNGDAFNAYQNAMTAAAYAELSASELDPDPSPGDGPDVTGGGGLFFITRPGKLPGPVTGTPKPPLQPPNFSDWTATVSMRDRLMWDWENSSLNYWLTISSPDRPDDNAPPVNNPGPPSLPSDPPVKN